MFTAWIRFSNSEKMAAKASASSPKTTVARRAAFTCWASLRGMRTTSTVLVVARALSSALVLLMPALKIMASSRPTMPIGRWSIT